MMFQRSLYICCVVCSILLTPGCVKEDFSKISGDYDWRASFSLPVSSISKTNESFRGENSLVDMYNMLGMVIHRETVDFDLSEIFIKSEYVDSLMLRLDIDNNFPAEIEVYAYYINDRKQVVRNVIAESSLKIEKPNIDEDGNITHANHILHDERFLKEDIPALLETKQILVRVFIRNMDLSAEVINKIDDFSIDISIGLRSAVTRPVDEI